MLPSLRGIACHVYVFAGTFYTPDTCTKSGVSGRECETCTTCVVGACLPACACACVCLSTPMRTLCSMQHAAYVWHSHATCREVIAVTTDAFTYVSCTAEPCANLVLASVFALCVLDFAFACLCVGTCSQSGAPLHYACFTRRTVCGHCVHSHRRYGLPGLRWRCGLR